jgi:hypothetical protein
MPVDALNRKNFHQSYYVDFDAKGTPRKWHDIRVSPEESGIILPFIHNIFDSRESSCALPVSGTFLCKGGYVLDTWESIFKSRFKMTLRVDYL